MQFPDRNQVEAEIIGFDPFADVALLKVDPEGLELDPIELGSLDDVEVGDPVAAIGSPFGERQSLSVGVVSATDRSIPSLTAVPDRRRDPDRRLDQPRQLGRAAARRREPRDRDQPADRHHLGRQPGRRLRRADRPRRSVDRPASRGRRGRVRVHRGREPAALPAARRERRRSTSTPARSSSESCRTAPPTTPASAARSPRPSRTSARSASRPPSVVRRRRDRLGRRASGWSSETRPRRGSSPGRSPARAVELEIIRDGERMDARRRARDAPATAS